MEDQVLLEHKNLRVDYRKKGHYIHETWWGSTIGDTFPNLLEEIVEILMKYKISGLLLDAREHKGLSPANQELAAQKIGDVAKKLGKLKQAIVVPHDVFSKFSVDSFAQKLEKEEDTVVITRYFDDLDDAIKWLENE